MQTCPSCGAPPAPSDQFCRTCGRPLAATAGPAEATPPPAATVLWTGTPPARREHRSTIGLDLLFAQKAQITIGRSPECDVCLPHPSISRYHALLERTPRG